MIATLEGVVSEKLADQVILDIKGVGYGIFVTAEDHGLLKAGEKSKVYVYDYVREQAHDLFGFLTRDTKDLFEQLLAVSGVGPKMALNVLSIGSLADVRSALAEGNIKFIQQANGVGRRLAERLVVELKDKVGLNGADLESAGLLRSEAKLLGDEAVQALVALGYSSSDAAAALQEVDPELPTEDRVKQALIGGKK